MKRFGRLAMLWAVCLAISLLGIGAMAEQDAASDREARDSLAYAVAGTQESDSSLALDQAKIEEKFGEGAMLRIADQGVYGEGLTAGEGVVLLSADGEERYVLVDNGEGIALWAGVFGGRTDVAPQAILYYETQEEANEEGLVLDIAEVVGEYGDGVQVHEADAERGYVKIDPDEDGVCLLTNGAEESVLVRISVRQEGQEEPLVLWAGTLTGAAQRIVYHLYTDEKPAEEPGEWAFTIDRVDRQGIAMTFSGKAAEEDVRERIALSFDFADRNGGAVGEKREEAPKISGIGSYTYECDWPENAVSVTVSLIYDGEEKYSADAEIAAEATVTPEPTVEPTAEATATPEPTAEPTVEATATPEPTAEPTAEATATPEPTAEPTATPEPTAEPTATPEPTAEPTATPEPTAQPTAEPTEIPVLTVRLDGLVSTYDGQTHVVTATAENGEEISCWWTVRHEGEMEPSAWLEGLPEGVDAEEKTVWIRVEKEGYIVKYVDSNGQPIAADYGYAELSFRIDPVPVKIRVWAEQAADATYNGDEQKIPVRFMAEIAEDASGRFDLSRVTTDARWISEGSISGKDAGAYPIEPAAGQFDFAAGIDPNFCVTVEWQASEAVIGRKPIELKSASKAAVYGSISGALSSDERVQGTDGIEDGDYYSGDIIARGEQTETGVGRNTIELTGTFATKQGNYEFDLEKSAGALVIFPQSISESDPELNAAQINPEDYIGMSAEELPGYYLGMRVELKKTSAPYSGREQEIEVTFRSREGALLEMREDIDYQVEYFRDGVQTGDLTSGGTIAVRITGRGNYSGTVERTFEIEPVDVGNVEAQINSWTYDGEAAGSAAHPLTAENAPTECVYRDAAGNVIDAPVNVGSYTVQAIWAATDSRLAAESKPYAFEIWPAGVNVTIVDGQVTGIEDESGLFSADMIEHSGTGYSCANANFSVRFDVTGEDPANRASVQIDSWTYDGEAAGSEKHPVALNGLGAEATCRYYDAEGAEISAPMDAGSYKVVAEGEGRTAEAEFTIAPAAVTVRASDAQKTYGDADPELTAAIEGAADDEAIRYELTREAGEDAGSYAIIAQGEEMQGNYAVTFAAGTLTIEARYVGEAEALLLEDEAIVWDDLGRMLSEGADYTIRMGTSADNPHEQQAVICGVGNYEGELSVTSAAGPLEMQVVLEDAENITAAANGLASFGGQIILNKPVRAERLSIWIGGRMTEADITAVDESIIRFSVQDCAMPEDRPDTISLGVAVGGEERAAQELPVEYAAEKILWIALAIVLAIASAVSLLICIRLTKRLKKEQYKLLDEVSRKSSRTIRENEE